MANFQVGKKAKFWRGATRILYCKTINPPKAKTNRIKVTNLDSDAQEYISDYLPDYPEMTIKFQRDLTETTQNTIESDFHSGNNAVEAWHYEICHNVTGAVLRTYAFNGFLSGCDTGPISVDEAVEMEVTIQLTGSLTIT